MYMYTFASSRSSAEREGGKSAQSAVGVSGIGVRNKWAALSWLVQERLKLGGSGCWEQSVERFGAGCRGGAAEYSAGKCDGQEESGTAVAGVE
jgi:hypothetical protein